MTTAALAPDRMTFGEAAPGRHEFVGGVAHAMGGASDRYDIASGNLFAALHARLAGGRCRAFMADKALHVHLADDDALFYPAVMVCRDPSDAARLYRKRPVFIAEVASPPTERIDRREKFTACRTIRQCRNTRSCSAIPRVSNFFAAPMTGAPP